MDAKRFPSLRCILKQCLKLAQDVVYGKQKVFLADILILTFQKLKYCLRKGIKIEFIK